MQSLAHCSRCRRAVPAHQSHSVPMRGSLYVSRCLCPECVLVEGAPDLSCLGGLLAVLLIIHLVFSLGQAIFFAAP